MAIRTIITEPNKILRQISKPVDKVGIEEQKLMDDMLETMYDANGIGLAAIQVGVPKRIIVMDILGAVKRGIDMFDCVLPTRSGRTGLAFTWNGRINIRNAKYQNDNTPLNVDTNKFSLNKYTKNYLNHLFNTNEMLGSMLLTLHNINFYQELMSSIRKNIKNGTFHEFHDKYINKL